MTAAVTSAPTMRPVRLRPAPILEPPYDDEVSADPDSGPRIGPHDVELPLDWGSPGQTARHRTSRAPARIEGSRERVIRAGTADPVAGAAGRWRTTKGDLPLTIKQFADMYVEVLNERRPPRHLLPCVTDDVFHTIRLGLVRRGRGWWPVVRQPLAGGRRGLSDRPGSGPQTIRVRRLRACQPVPGAVEAAAVLVRGNETRAVAFRLEYHGARWTCTAFQFLG